jgi:hypothetical protein
MKLTDSIIKNLKPTEKRQQVADGNGLVLYVEAIPKGTKLWRYRYRFGGKAKMLSLGDYPAVSLKEARLERERLSVLIKKGLDPSLERQENKLRQSDALKNDFMSVSEAWWGGWKGDKTEAHADKVWGVFTKDIFPIMGKHPVDSVKPSLIRLAIAK